MKRPMSWPVWLGLLLVLAVAGIVSEAAMPAAAEGAAGGSQEVLSIGCPAGKTPRARSAADVRDETPSDHAVRASGDCMSFGQCY
jgi:hypothetical protein